MANQKIDDENEFLESEDDFNRELEIAIREAYPALLNRVRTAGFAGYRRRLGLEKDLADEAVFHFIKHCKRKHTLPDNALKYLVAIARNIAKKEYRNKDRITPLSRRSVSSLSIAELTITEDIQEVELEGDEASYQEILMEKVRIMIEKLPPKQRKAVKLHIEDPAATQKQQAERMGVDEGAFRKDLTRAMDRLKRELNP